MSASLGRVNPSGPYRRSSGGSARTRRRSSRPAGESARADCARACSSRSARGRTFARRRHCRAEFEPRHRWQDLNPGVRSAPHPHKPRRRLRRRIARSASKAWRRHKRTVPVPRHCQHRAAPGAFPVPSHRVQGPCVSPTRAHAYLAGSRDGARSTRQHEHEHVQHHQRHEFFHCRPSPRFTSRAGA